MRVFLLAKVTDDPGYKAAVLQCRRALEAKEHSVVMQAAFHCISDNAWYRNGEGRLGISMRRAREKRLWAFAAGKSRKQSVALSGMKRFYSIPAGIVWCAEMEAA